MSPPCHLEHTSDINGGSIAQDMLLRCMLTVTHLMCDKVMGNPVHIAPAPFASGLAGEGRDHSESYVHSFSLLQELFFKTGTHDLIVIK
jgi:hypothetical protein